MSTAAARPFSIELRVRYGETDQMGVVYHAHYLSWCDVARTEYIRTLGASYAELERDGLLLAVTEVTVRYHASARYDDDIRIEVWPEAVQSRAVTFGYRVLRGADGHRLATVSTRLTALNRAGAPRVFPAALLARLREAVAAA